MGFMVKINRTISAPGGNHYEPGQVIHTSKMPGVDVNWLVGCGAMTPVGASRYAPLVSDNPSQEELVSEIGRMQDVMEKTADENSHLRRELDRVRAENDGLRAEAERSSPAVDPLHKLLGVTTDPAKAPDPDAEARVKRAEDDRDGARQRADQYAARVTELEGELRAARGHAAADAAGGPGTTGAGKPDEKGTPPEPPTMDTGPGGRRKK